LLPQGLVVASQLGLRLMLRHQRRSGAGNNEGPDGNL
jgi:hypothetical protein